MSNLKIGVTGGIASGKTTVTDRFAEKGIAIIDADVISRETVMPGEPALDEIVNKFGRDVLLNDGNLNRAKLREIVFTTPSEKEWLNALLHPLIRNRMLNLSAQAKSSYCVLSIPLLFENGLQTIVDRVLVIDTPEENQLQRALKRDGSSKSVIEKIMQSQVTRQARLEGADEVINNSGDISFIHSQVEELHKKYLALSKKRMNNNAGTT
ncbi:MAG: dephospho-CoA kinase [Pseudomonadota bacterium]